MIDDDYSTREKLREQVAQLEAQLEKERTHRRLLETTLEGLETMALVEGGEQAFEIWTRLARDLLEFEHAFVLTRQGDQWQVELATEPSLHAASWPHSGWFDRVLQSSSPTVCFDASMLPAWSGVEAPPESSLPTMTSLILIPLQWETSKALMVCTHTKPAKFSSNARQTYHQLGILASQVFVSLMHRNSRIERDAAKRADQAKGHFLATMSHELRTPLNIIIGYGELILEESDDEHYVRNDMKEDMHRMLGSARHLLEVVGNVLDLSRIEKGRMEIAATVFDLQEFLAQLARDVRPLFEKRDNHFEVEQDDSVPKEWRGDRVRIRQILFNLLANAGKFTSNGEVVLRVRYQQDRLSLSVDDSGTGITEEHLHRIFDIFERVEGGHGEQEGSGLGLPISKKLAQIMGGDLTAESEPGVGSCFTLWLPTLEAE
jgi:signal transduction histidine kinase